MPRKARARHVAPATLHPSATLADGLFPATTRNPPLRGGGRTVLFGSSTMERHAENTGAGGINRVAQLAHGPFTWLNAMLGNRFSLVKNLGVGGQTTTQILARIADVFDADPDIVWVHCGTNDVFASGLAASVPYANIVSICEQLLSRRIRVVLCLPQKWANADTDVNAAKLVQYFTLLKQLTDYAETRPGIFLVNFPAALVDPASTTGDHLTDTFVDNKHVSNLGAYRVAKSMLAAFSAWMEGTLAPLDERTNFLADSFFGTTKAATAPITGTVWNSFTVARAAGTPACACSVVGSPDGHGLAQRLQITANAANDRITATIPSASWFSGVAIGDRIVFEIDVYIASSSQLRAFPAYLVRNAGNLNIIGLGRDLQTVANDKPLPDEQIRVTIQSTPWDVSEGTTSLDAAITFLFKAAGAADVYVWNPRVRKVPSLPRFY